MSRVTVIISALVICIIVCLSWAVNHYRDNAITYKAQRDKNAQQQSDTEASRLKYTEEAQKAYDCLLYTSRCV